ncbi:hypothetical protein AA106556_1800 [Neokomagataea tanensis NBRC 106556]|uniref:Uncharacterized protein n=1 Tax=Neokomagataea tanensis NBRC 106556 TaxID=1223519 RepID=A0ABQ0QKW7_9PROT|nr:hypothetical protein AA106556_1800 [Neokomagataea tanensis NBRC 106556]
MQTNRVGGVSVTLETAEAVKPYRPCSPLVVIIVTALARRAMASRKIWVLGSAVFIRFQMVHVTV